MQNKYLTEVLWWCVALLIAIFVVAPIWFTLDSYPLLGINILLVVLAVTFVRYIFLFRTVFFARMQIVKIALIFIMVPVLFLVFEQLFGFLGLVEEGGLNDIVAGLPYEEQSFLKKYIREEMVWAGATTLFAGALFPMRLIVSIWRVINTPDKV